MRKEACEQVQRYKRWKVDQEEVSEGREEGEGYLDAGDEMNMDGREGC